MIYRFEAYALDADRYELRRGSDLVPVEPQVLDVLLHFVRNRGRLVSRDDLIAGVWDGRIVSESTLTSRVCAARHAIGDDGEQQRLIRTLPRKGYRFIAVVQESIEAGKEEAGLGIDCHDATRSAPWCPSSSLRDRASILVLPFANLSADSEQDRFIDGLVDDITAALSRFRHLLVIGRNATLGYKRQALDIKRLATELGARYVIEGTLRKEESRIRIAVQLIESSTMACLWASRSDGSLRNAFRLQDQITASVVGALVSKVEQVEIERIKIGPKRELDAYSCTLRGLDNLHQWTKDGIGEALHLFQRAIEIEPEFASAYAMAAYCYVQRQSYGWITDRPRETAECVQLALRAAELGKDDALALARAAHAISAVGGDVEGGVSLIERAIQLNPHLTAAWYVSGWIMLFLGKPEAAIQHLQRAIELSPYDRLVFKIHAAMAYAHFFSRRYDAAVASAGEALRDRPNYLTALRVASASHGLGGRHIEGRRLMAKMCLLDPGLQVSGLADLLPFRREKDSAKWAGALQRVGLPD
ncbi:MAG TPA: winged helix-turn-helix domain-containing protein [Bryobacteraceae bacterium]|nr:winged helix-turn-helix domain-containing protein [Bryobacteraceae bacterium]